MPDGRNSFQFVVDDPETVLQHGRAPDELHVGTETRQIVDNQHETPHGARFAVSRRRGEHVINVQRHGDDGEISQQVPVQHLQGCPAGGVHRPSR